MDITDRLRAALAGCYDLEREIGRGGMAVVYLARDLKHDRRVALKVLRPELAVSLTADRFLREIQIAAELQHPLIVPLYDSGDSGDGLLWYAMPYVEGETLRQRLRREGQLPLEDALRIAADAGEALGYAHQHGIVHRDIKPENLLLSSGHAIVADFGIARALTQAAGGVSSSSVVVGTPAYMSPEQGAGNKMLDARSDIYSLGCVLYEMLAGEPPFTGPTPQAVIARHVSETPPTLHVVRPSVSEAIEAALDKALAKTPADRFSTASAFIAALSAPARPGAKRRRRAAAMLVPAVAAAALAWWGWRALAPAPLDPDRYLVASFGRGPAGEPPLLDPDQTQWRLSAALRSWDGISVVDNFQVKDALARASVAEPTQGDWVRAARGLGAGRLVRGEVARVGDTTFITASVFDVASGGRPVQQRTEPLTEQGADLPARFAQLAAGLLGLQPPAAVAWSTRSVGAGKAYVAGSEALESGDLAAAADSFLAATRLDPQFADAYFWLAASQAWRGQNVEVWAEAARRAVDLRSRMGDPRARRLIAGLVALAEEQYPQACDRFRAVIALDSTDFAAWVGLGECQFRDGAVVRDPDSPSRMRFRSSYASAAGAYRRAFELAPWLTGAFLQRPVPLFFVDPGEVRSGHALAPDTGVYWAQPGLLHDTLAFVPFPAGEVRAGKPGTQPATLGQALARNRETLRRLAESWAVAYPASPEALGAAAEAAEQSARVSHDDALLDAALERVTRAIALARRQGASLRLGQLRVRLFVKLSRLPEAREAAEALLAAHQDPGPAAADTLAPLAILVGKVHLGARLSAARARILSAPPGVPPDEIPLPALETLERLRAYAAAGGPPDSLRVLAQRADSAIRAAVARREFAQLRYRLLGEQTSLAFPIVGPGPVHGQPGPNDLLRMEDELAHGDRAAVRARLDAVDRVRAAVRPQDIALDRTFQEAWLRLQLGDSASAEQRLGSALSPLSGLGVFILSDVTQAGTLVRSMALLAEVAGRRGDQATAQRWAGAVADLWHDADPELEPLIRQARTLRAAGR